MNETICVSAPHVIAPSLYRKLSYDLARDFAPVTLIGSEPLCVAVHPSLPVKSVRDFVAFLKRQPGEVSYGSTGNGAVNHLATELFKSRAGVDMVHVPYNMQALVWAAIELRKQVSVGEIAAVDVETYWSAWHESGSEPAKWDPRTRETTDHSLPYILAWTLRHGLIDQRAFVPESYLDPSIRPFMNRVTVRINDEFEKDFPRVVRMRVTATDHSGKSYQACVINPLGHEDNPVSAAELAAKFMRLREPRLGAARVQSALKQWQNIDAAADVATAFDAVVVEAATGDRTVV